MSRSQSLNRYQCLTANRLTFEASPVRVNGDLNLSLPAGTTVSDPVHSAMKDETIKVSTTLIGNTPSTHVSFVLLKLRRLRHGDRFLRRLPV